MKRILFLCMVVLMLQLPLQGQNIPNRGFEQWQVVEMYEDPVSWLTSNMMLGQFGEPEDSLLVARKAPEAYSGDWALHLQNEVIGEDTIVGFAICEGQVTGDYPDLELLGGFPYTGQPDSLIGYFRYDLPEGDTARLLVAFKKTGQVIALRWITLTGSQDNYVRLAFVLPELTQVPDTAFVAVSSGTPWATEAEGELWVDDLSFDGQEGSIPNGGFETWEMLSYQDPAGWKSGNWITTALRQPPMCEASSEAHSGEKALRLETVALEIFGSNSGIVTAGELYVGGLEGGFPVQATPTAIQGYYRYLPATNDDLAQVLVICSRWNSGTGEREYRYRLYQLGAADDYTPFSFTLNLGDFAPDTVNVTFSSGVMFTKGQPPVGSVLYVDDLWLENPCGAADTTDLISFSDTTICAGDSLILDAGEGYAAYEWSDGSTDRTITVSDSGVYSVTVTGADGCRITDAVTVHMDPCTGVVSPEQDDRPRLYPNPFSNTLHIFLPDEGEAVVTITNILGQKVLERRIAGRDPVVDADGLSPGLYLVRIRWKDGEQVMKVLKR